MSKSKHPKLTNIQLERASDKSMGLIRLEGHWDNNFFQVKFQFPRDAQLFSPNGDYHLTLHQRSWPANFQEVTIDDEHDEAFRDALGSSFVNLNYQKLRAAVKALLQPRPLTDYP